VLQPGAQVGGYRIERRLGQGGMGVVYEATQLSLQRRVALKVLSPELSADPAFGERFRREGRLQATIEHPHIVTVYEAGEVPEGLFIAMRLVRGRTLKALVAGGPLPPDRLVRLLGPVADALDAAHEAGLVHRDVKPQNILVGDGDRPYLSDFGLTKGEGQAGITRTGQFVGTLDYVSPEQISGGEATAASDVYSFGAVVVECATGAVPYVRSTDVAVMWAHVNAPTPSVSTARDDLPEALDDVVAQAMAKEPAERPVRASDVVAAVQRALAEPPAAAAPDTTRWAPPFADPDPEPRPPAPADEPTEAPASAEAEAPTEPRASAALDSSIAPEPARPGGGRHRARPRRRVVLAAGGGLALAAAAAVVLATRSGDSPPDAGKADAASPPGAAAAAPVRAAVAAYARAYSAGDVAALAAMLAPGFRFQAVGRAPVGARQRLAVYRAQAARDARAAVDARAAEVTGAAGDAPRARANYRITCPACEPRSGAWTFTFVRDGQRLRIRRIVEDEVP
jgi:Protein kinase domain/Domain of unknown function (DUF4440)